MEQTNELVEKIIKEAIGDYLNERTIKAVLKEVVKDFVRKEFVSYFSAESNKYVNNLIEEEIKNILSQEVNTDDGWGRTSHYDSFKDLFKAEFRKKLDSTWEMKNIIERAVKDEMKKLFEEKAKEITPKIHNMVLDEILNPSK